MAESENDRGSEEMGWQILMKDLDYLASNNRIEAEINFHKNNPRGNQQSFSSLHASYDAAFRALLRSMDDGEKGLSSPTFYIMRHAIELCLKSTIEYYSNVTKLKPNLIGHNLLTLWGELQKQYLAAGYKNDNNNDWDDFCEKIIRHVHDCDPTGERFRYPIDNKGNIFHLSKVEWKSAYAAYLHLTYICESAEEMLDDLGIISASKSSETRPQHDSDEGVIY